MILIYLLKSALCLGILFGFYKLALEGKAMHHFKRFYLLASLVFSFTIPLITFTYQAAEAPQITPIFQEYVETVSAPNQVPQVTEVDYTNTANWGIYLLGVFIFGTRFIVNLVRLKRKIHQAELHPSSHFTLALLEQVMVPHSFLKWIFVNRQSYTQQEIAPEVLAHEATHVRQKHSLDIIAIEFIQVIFWFNPLVWLFKSSIKLNHEFLADQGAIADKSNIAIYQNILLSYASSTHHTALESPFNYSLTKKRIVMLSQSFSRKKVVLRALLLIPIIGLCVLFFNQAIVAQSGPNAVSGIMSYENSATNTLELELDTEGNFYYKLKPISLKGIENLIKETVYDYLTIQGRPGISSKLGREKQLLVAELWNFSRVTFCTSNLVDDQNAIFDPEANALVKANFVKSKKPNYEDLVKWQNTSLFAIFLDNEEISNKTILDYHPDDLPYYAIGDRTNGRYRVDVWTSPYWQSQKHLTTKAPQTSTYATQFIEGATRNGKNALVIEVRNDSIYINGQYSPLDSFRESVDNITAQWTKEEFAAPVRSMIFKGNSKEFINKAEAVFRQTQLYKANNSLRLIPPAPPAPPAPSGELPPPPPPPSPEEHLLKMHKLGSLFIHNGKEVTYEEAVRLAKGGVTEIKTPYPYSNPPKTFIGSKDNNVPQKPAIKKGDTLTITVTETGQKALAVMNNNKNGVIIDKLPENAGVDGRQLEIYNRLTSKYKNKTIEQIPAADLKTIQIIYDDMNDEQKDKNQPNPINPKSKHFEVKASYDEDGSLSKDVEQHALKGGTFEFEGKEISKEEAILKSKEPNISTQTSTLHNKMIIHKDLLQQKVLYYYNDKLLSDDEMIELFENPLYTMQLISKGSNKEKPSFKFVKIKE
ncbi:M56 family metallopeptidase [Dokdonia sp. PRO95]|uniref:M56 family metallopeptidase n=1 Tax=Dokdonia sp. PRO95 TaxID=1239415 RepID=UPI000557EC1F|nr:M56 family metallopeptidase [Dokdonia sp. PRO95]